MSVEKDSNVKWNGSCMELMWLRYLQKPGLLSEKELSLGRSDTGIFTAQVTCKVDIIRYHLLWGKDLRIFQVTLWKKLAVFMILILLFQVCIVDKTGHNKKGNKNLLKYISVSRTCALEKKQWKAEKQERNSGSCFL